jgi:hypothetical protein
MPDPVLEGVSSVSILALDRSSAAMVVGGSAG